MFSNLVLNIIVILQIKKDLGPEKLSDRPGI